MRPVSKDKRTTYNPGTWMNPYYSTFWGYYGYGWGSMYIPGSVEQDTIIVVETTIYSIPRNQLVWAAVSETKNPKTLQRFVEDLVKESVKELHKQGLARGHRQVRSCRARASIGATLFGFLPRRIRLEHPCDDAPDRLIAFGDGRVEPFDPVGRPEPAARLVFHDDDQPADGEVGTSLVPALLLNRFEFVEIHARAPDREVAQRHVTGPALDLLQAERRHLSHRSPT